MSAREDLLWSCKSPKTSKLVWKMLAWLSTVTPAKELHPVHEPEVMDKVGLIFELPSTACYTTNKFKKFDCLGGTGTKLAKICQSIWRSQEIRLADIKYNIIKHVQPFFACKFAQICNNAKCAFNVVNSRILVKRKSSLLLRSNARGILLRLN